jgi:proline dehydrogenase
MSVMRKVLLAGSTNVWLRERATKAAFVRRAVSAFMPGETIEDALRAAQEQKRVGINTILTRLGENITRVEEAEEVTHHYLEVLDKVAAAGLDAHVSVKPTQLGLDQDPALCRRNLDRLLERTAERNNFLWIDMEGSPYVDPTLELYRYGRARSSRIGVAIQAYLFRSEKDVESLIPLGSAVRLVKGAYLEPPDIAYPQKADVDEAHRLDHGEQCSVVCLRVRDAVRDPARPAAAAGEGRQAPASAHQLRGVLVPVVHAPACRASGQRVVRREESVRMKLSALSFPPSALGSRPSIL